VSYSPKRIRPRNIIDVEINELRIILALHFNKLNPIKLVIEHRISSPMDFMNSIK
jgi:hypothetical protein